jgi:TP901 family phage tail tape measure protein
MAKGETTAAGGLSTQYVITAEMQAEGVKETLSSIAEALTKINTALQGIRGGPTIPPPQPDPKAGEKYKDQLNKQIDDAHKDVSRNRRGKKTQVEIPIDFKPQVTSTTTSFLEKQITATYGNKSLKDINKALNSYTNQLKNLFTRFAVETEKIMRGEESKVDLKALEKKASVLATSTDILNQMAEKAKVKEEQEALRLIEQQKAQAEQFAQKYEQHRKDTLERIKNITLQSYQGKDYSSIQRAYESALKQRTDLLVKLQELDVQALQDPTSGKKTREKMLFKQEVLDARIEALRSLLDNANEQERIAQEYLAKLQRVRELLNKSKLDFEAYKQSLTPLEFYRNVQQIGRLAHTLRQAEEYFEIVQQTGSAKALDKAQSLLERFKNQSDLITGRQELLQHFSKEQVAEIEHQMRWEQALIRSRNAIAARAMGGAAESHSIIYRDLAKGFDPEKWQKYYTLGKQLERIRAQLIESIVRQKVLGISSYSVIPLFDEMGNKVGQFAVLVDRSGKVLINFERGLKELFTTMFYRMSVWAVATQGVYMFINGLKNAVNYIIEVSRNIALLKVAAEGMDFGKLFKGLINTVAEYGGDLKSVIDIVYEFVKVLGNEQEALRATRLALIAYNISGLDYKESATLLIGVMKQYGLTIKETEQLLDAWALASKRGTVDFKEMAQAFNQTAASAKSLGISMQELTALIELVGTATGESGAVLGTFMKFILEHARDLDVLSILQNNLGINVLKANGAYRDTADILAELAEKWNNLNDSQKQYISEAWAGVRQGPRFKALMETMSSGEYGDLLREINMAQGEAAAQNAEVMNTLEGQLRRLRSNYSGFITSFSDTGPARALKELLIILNSFIGGVQKLNNIGIHTADIILGILGAIGLKFYELGRKTKSVVGELVQDITVATKSVQSNLDAIAAKLGATMRVVPGDIKRRIEVAFGSELSPEEINRVSQQFMAFAESQGWTKTEKPERSFIFEQRFKELRAQYQVINRYSVRSDFTKNLLTDFQALKQALIELGQHWRVVSAETLNWSRISRIAISGVRTAVLGLGTAIVSAFKWFLIIEAVMKAFELFSRMLDKIREERIERQEMGYKLPYLNYQEVQDIYNRWDEIRNIRPLSEEEQNKLSELQSRILQGEVLSAGDESYYKALKERQEMLRQRNNLEVIAKAMQEATLAYYSQFSDILITPSVSLDEFREQYLKEHYGLSTQKKATEEQQKTMQAIIPDLNAIKAQEEELNRWLDINNRLLDRRFTILQRLKDSYMDLGFSENYYANVVGEIYSTFDSVVQYYENLSGRYSQAQANFLRAQAALINERQRLASEGKLEAVERAYYSGVTTENDDVTAINQYKQIMEAYERSYSIYTKTQDAMTEAENKMIDLKKQTLETILSTEQYAGVWDNIQQRVKLVQQLLSEVRYHPFKIQGIFNVADFGKTVFGRGWDSIDYMVSNITQQINSMFGQIAEIEFMRLTAGSDTEALKKALEDLLPMDEKIYKKVTEPLLSKTDQLMVSMGNLRDSIDKLKSSFESGGQNISFPGAGTVAGISRYKESDNESSFPGAGTVAGLNYGLTQPQKASTGLKTGRDIMQHLMKYGIPEADARILAAVAFGESSYNPNAVGDSGQSIGLFQIHMPAHADKLRRVTGSDNPEDWIRYLQDPYKNIYMAYEVYKSQGLGAWTVYKKGTYKPYLDILDRLEIGKGTNNALITKTMGEHQKAINTLEDMRIRYYEMINSNINLLPKAFEGVVEFIQDRINLLNKIGEIWYEANNARTEVVKTKLDLVYNTMLQFPQLVDQLYDRLKETVTELFNISRRNIEEQTQRQLIFNNLLGSVSFDKKRSEVFQQAIQQYEELANNLPIEQLPQVRDAIKEKLSLWLSAFLKESFDKTINEFNINLLTSGLTVLGVRGLGDSIIQTLVEAIQTAPLALRPQLFNLLQKTLPVVEDLRNNPGLDASIVKQSVINLINSAVDTPEFYKNLNLVTENYQQATTLSKVAEQLQSVFDNLAGLVNVYPKLAEIKTTLANINLNKLYTQISQVEDVFKNLTPLSMSYYAVLSDLVNLYQKEHDLMSQRVEDTRKYFELTGKGLNEFIATSGKVDRYNISLLQNLRAQTFNTARDFSGDIDEYYALLREVVSLEKEWRDILRERTDALAEAFRLGIIDLQEYVDKLEELRDKTYELRDLGLKSYDSIFGGIQSGFSRALAEALQGTSINPQGDFVTAIKETLATTVSDIFTQTLFNATNIRQMLEQNVVGVINSIFTGQSNIDIDTIRNNLNTIVSTLSSYFPVFKQALGGIFETLKDQVFNAPSGFKIEPYVYEYIKGKGMEDIPGLITPGTPSELPNLPIMPDLGVEPSKTVPEINTNLLQETLERVANISDELLTTGNEEVNALNKISSFFEQLLAIFNVQPEQWPGYIETARIEPGDYKLENGRAYMWSRELARLLNTSVEWNETTGQVIIGGKVFTPKEVTPEGKSYVSVREVAEALGYQVDYLNDSQEIVIRQLIDQNSATNKIANNINSLNQSVGQLNNVNNTQNNILGNTYSLLGTINGKISQQVDILSNINSNIKNLTNTSTKTVTSSIITGSTTTTTSSTGIKYKDATGKLYSADQVEYFMGTYYVKGTSIAVTPVKYHSGGIVNNEQLAILRRDEMVLPPNLTSSFISFLDNADKLLLNNTPSISTANSYSFQVEVNINGNTNIDDNMLNLIKSSVNEGIQNALRQQNRDNRLARLRRTGVSYSY